MRRTNFIPDVVRCDLPLDNRRSPGYRRVEPFMTNNTFYYWIGQHENGRYSKAHAHTSAAVLICIQGKGYTYTWPERFGVTPWKDGHADQIKRIDYGPVGMISAAPGGARWYHRIRRVERTVALDAWFGPWNPGREHGPPGREAYGLQGRDIPEGGPRFRTGWRIAIKTEYEETLRGTVSSRGCGRNITIPITKASCRARMATLVSSLGEYRV